MDFYGAIRLKRKEEHSCRALVGDEADTLEQRCAGADGEADAIRAEADAKIAALMSRVANDRERAGGLRRTAADIGLRIDAMDLLLMDAPAVDTPPPPVQAAEVQRVVAPGVSARAGDETTPKGTPLYGWLTDFLSRHPTSDYTVAQLVQAAIREGVEQTRSSFDNRIRGALDARIKGGTVERREAERGAVFRIVRRFATEARAAG